MAIGTVRGSVIATTDLRTGMAVIVDHERYEVGAIEYAGDLSRSDYKITLVPQFGDVWVLEVRDEDIDEPMWELA